MTTPDTPATTGTPTSTTNSAAPGSTVGIQAEQVANSTVYQNSAVYQVLPDSTPAQKYEIGVCWLEGGNPHRARELIHDAIVNDYDTSQVRFHWVLAMLSKRSYRDLSLRERQEVERMCEEAHHDPTNEWAQALEAIRTLLDCLKRFGENPGLAVKQLHALPARQYDQVTRHLDLVLTGALKSSLWSDLRDKAEQARLSADRCKRVWAYFHPAPAPARVRHPVDVDITTSDRVRAIGSTAVFVAAVGYLGWLILPQPLPLLAYALGLASGYVGIRNGVEWRYRRQRCQAKERDYFTQRGVNHAPEGGFASRTDHAFSHYFGKYMPTGINRDSWLAETRGIRTTLRNEVVDLYRETRIPIEKVTWLISYMARDVRDRWKVGTLREHRRRYRVDAPTKTWCTLGLATLAFASTGVITAAIQTHPIAAVVATLIGVVTGREAVARWQHITSERRRVIDEQLESDQLLDAREKAFRRWQHKLNSTRPDEQEMETWLNADITMLLDEALRQYKLSWHDILAHTILHTPARNSKRSRIPGGPTRYSKYHIWLYLITPDGVREVSTQLNFEQAAFTGRTRTNFRFDAVSSVHVNTPDELSYTLELTLMNGPTREIRITDTGEQQPDPSEDPNDLSQTNLAATGFSHTLHILEGIAAEGKGWIDRDPHINKPTTSSTAPQNAPDPALWYVSTEN